MIPIARINIVVVGVFLGFFFMLPSAHAQYFDDFGGFGGWDYGFDSFGGFSGSGYDGLYDPCGFGGCGAGVSYDSYGGSYGYGGYSSGCGSSCFGGFGGGYFQPFTPFYGGGFYQTSSQSSSSVYAPTTIDDHSVVTTTITTASAPAYAPQPIYISQPVYSSPVYYPPPIYTPPVYQQPIVCSAQFTNFSPPSTATSWQLYSYRITAVSTITGQMNYRLITAPDGMGINSATGQITWTPGTNQARSAAYQVTVAAYNGSCETAQTFYVTVRAQSVVVHTPPVVVAYVAPKPKPKPVPVCVCPVVEKPADSIVCPPAQTAPSTTVNGGSVLANAARGFWGGITALLASPLTLLLIIIILIILLMRAHRRLGEKPIVI